MRGDASEVVYGAVGEAADRAVYRAVYLEVDGAVDGAMVGAVDLARSGTIEDFQLLSAQL